MLRVEFHCHTIYSPDSLTQPEALLRACREKGIDRVVVTDHNTIAGARCARALDPERVIVGEEIMTTDGEILAAFVQEEVPPGLSPLKTIELLREQGAFISVSHPFDRARQGHWSMPGLLDIAPLVDAIEIFNSRCWGMSDNTLAANFAREHGLHGTAGSDAHAPFELGRALMLLPDFSDAGSLKAAMPQVEFLARMSSSHVHFYSTYAKWRKRLGRFKNDRPPC